MKAYENQEFLSSSDGRILRVLGEFLEPRRRLRKHNIQDTIVFFGSARPISSSSAKENLAKIKQRIAASGHPTKKMEQELIRAEKFVELGHYYDDAVQLATMMTHWSKGLKNRSKRFIVCSGGGPGMMEAANRGASKEGKGLTVGFTISMPAALEQPNPYISPDLAFDFHYFFMRKYWFAYLAKALVIFPGGFGTLDELMEILTLMQTKKIKKPLPVVVYGRKYWDEVIHFESLVEWGTISAKDLKLFRYCDTPQEAFDYLTSELRRIHHL